MGRGITSSMLSAVSIVVLLFSACVQYPEIPDQNDPSLFEDTQAPRVTLNRPQDGAVLSGTVTISAEASDNIAVDHVEFYLDNLQFVNGYDADAPYEYSWDTTVLPDSSKHSLFVKAFDTSSNYSFSDTIQVTVNNTVIPPGDSDPPTTSVLSPDDGSVVSGTVTLSASATDNVGVEYVEFFIDGIVPQGGTEYNAPYEYSWDTTVMPNGSVHSIFTRATDTSDNAAYSDTIFVTVSNSAADVTPPTVSISNPAEGATVSGTVYVSAAASDNVEVDHVDFYIDGVSPSGSIQYNPPYDYYWNTTGLVDGSIHAIVAKATDTSNNTAFSDTVHVTVDNSGGGGGGSSEGVVLNEDFTGRQIFPANNWWNIDVSNAPVDPGSQSYINWIGGGTSMHPDFGHSPYGIPYVGVSGDQALRIISFYSYGSESDDGAPGRPAGYPIPDEAYLYADYIEGGVAGGGGSGDRHLLLIDRDNWLLFETFGTTWSSSQQRWEAASGAVFNLATNDRRPEGWTSTDAAGLAVFPGLVKYDEVYGSGEITHAFRFTTRATYGYVWPASHAAGSNSSAPPLGARLRLKASVDISGYPAPMQKIFRAMKKYGLILADNGSDMFVQGTMDERWDTGMLNSAFHSIDASDFEVIQLGWDPVNN